MEDEEEEEEAKKGSATNLLQSLIARMITESSVQ